RGRTAGPSGVLWHRVRRGRTAGAVRGDGSGGATRRGGTAPGRTAPSPARPPRTAPPPRAPSPPPRPPPAPPPRPAPRPPPPRRPGWLAAARHPALGRSERFGPVRDRTVSRGALLRARAGLCPAA